MNREKTLKMELCLCGVCAHHFYNSPASHIRRKDPYQLEKDVCTFCNVRYGFDYIVSSRNANMRKSGTQ